MEKRKFAIEESKKRKNMRTFESTAERIFRTNLSHLENETKRRLIELLASSLTFSASRKEEDVALLDKINGAWCDDSRTAEDEIEILRADRVQGYTRQIEEL